MFEGLFFCFVFSNFESFFEQAMMKSTFLQWTLVKQQLDTCSLSSGEKYVQLPNSRVNIGINILKCDYLSHSISAVATWADFTHLQRPGLLLPCFPEHDHGWKWQIKGSAAEQPSWLCEDRRSVTPGLLLDSHKVSGEACEVAPHRHPCCFLT